MAQSVSATIKGPNGPLSIVFGEGSPDQQVPWCEVAAAAFAPQVPASVFVEHGDALSQHPLARNKGIRYWCISLVDDPASVISMCGTIRRPLLVRDSESTREEDGYCVFMVATHTQYRRLGLAKMLMIQVAEWLDGPGGAAASMLYTSVGDVSAIIERSA
jgi:ribosomal protein S18 acetylase RimI-like enzyme